METSSWICSWDLGGKILEIGASEVLLWATTNGRSRRKGCKLRVAQGPKSERLAKLETWRHSFWEAEEQRNL